MGNLTEIDTKTQAMEFYKDNLKLNQKNGIWISETEKVSLSGNSEILNNIV